MESVGELLKQEREAQGKTIEDVAKATKMSTIIIAGLEADHFSVLPAPVYVKGHLRTYARHLGLSEDAVVDKYLRFTQQQESTELDEWDAIELELHEEKQRSGRRWVWIAAAAAVIVVVFIIWYLASRPGDPSDAVADAPATVTEPAGGTVAGDSMIEWHKLELLAVARERTWLSVSIDGEPVADLTLERGEERRWEAEEYFKLDVGNGGGLALYLDGEFLGTAGSGSRLVEGLVVNENGMSR